MTDQNRPEQMQETPDVERPYHLETWRVAPLTQQVEGATALIDDQGRTIADFLGENHRENATRVIKALTAPASRRREAQNYAIRQQLRVNARLRRQLTLKGFELDAAITRILESHAVQGPPDQQQAVRRAVGQTLRETALAKLAAKRGGRP